MTGPLSRDAVEPTVFLDGAPNPAWHVETITRTLGGSKYDTVALIADQTLLDRPKGDWLHDRHAGGGYAGLRVDVTLEGRPLFTGWVRKVAPRIGPGGPALQLLATLEPHHFGIQLRGPRIRSVSPVDQTERFHALDDEVILNPTIDGVRRNNRSGHNEAGRPVFVDVDQMQSTSATTWLNENFTVTVDNLEPGLPWTLAAAVYYFCWRLNELEDQVANPPSLEQLEQTLRARPADTRSPEPAHLQLPRHVHLPRVLDALLIPYGFTWYVVPQGPGAKPRLAFVPIGRGTEATLFFHPFGDQLDTDQAKAPEIELDYDIAGELVNNVVLIGDWGYVESTWELTRAWSESVSDVQPAELEDADESLHRVWREWVLNEAGDQLVNSLGPDGEITGRPYDFSRFAEGEFVNRRKRFLPCIAQHADGTPAGNVRPGILVEFSTDGGGTWYGAEALGCPIQVLQREAGIRFGGPSPPVLLMAAGRNARVRVTATLQTDRRIVKQAVALESPNPDFVQVVLDVSDRYHYRRIDDLSEYATEVRSGARTASEVDDEPRLADLAEELLTAWNVADCDGGITLEGLAGHAYELGQVITRIQGREVLLHTDTAGGRGPQIAAITYHNTPQQQRVTLALNSQRDIVQPS